MGFLGIGGHFVVLSRMRSNRVALWVLSERRINSVGAVYTEPAISRTSGGVHGGTSNYLMYRPSVQAETSKKPTTVDTAPRH